MPRESAPVLLESPCRAGAPVSEARAPQEVGTPLRCVCGSLMARRVPEGIELKCRRCKRTLLVPWSTFGDLP